MGLLDALRSGAQGASNAIASNVSAPVDALAWLLRKGGLPVNNPVGGSDWMAQQGLTAEPSNRIAGLLGEAVGGIGPAVMAAKAPQIAGGLLKMGENAMAPQAMGKQAGKVFVYPQDAALAKAQANAALPIEKGGLGLGPNNTAAERAKAMGFADDEMFHATTKDFQHPKVSPSGKLGPGFYTADNARYAEKYAGDGAQVMPLVSRGNFAPFDVRSDASEQIRSAMYKENPNFSVQDWKTKTADLIDSMGYSGTTMDVERAITKPSVLRSRFAAFDPVRRNENDLLGRVDPNLLAALAGGGLLGTAGYNAMTGQK